MSSSINDFTLTGGLAADPEVKWLADDGESGIVRLGVIVRFSKKDESGEWQDETDILDVTVNGKFAVLTAKKLKKFDSVTVKGFVKKDTWEQDGANRSALKLIARQIESDGYFRPADENNEVVVGDKPAPAPAPAAEAPAPAPAAAPASDDIPF